MTNPNDIRSTDDASALRRSTDPEANPVIGSAVDDSDLRDTEIDESAGPPIESLSRGELLRRLDRAEDARAAGATPAEIRAASNGLA